MKKHECFMQKKQCKRGNCMACTEGKICYSCKTRTEKYMFYDFEATQESGIHKVNWVDCQDFEGNISHFETIEEFCEFVFAVEEFEKKKKSQNTRNTHSSPTMQKRMIYNSS